MGRKKYLGGTTALSMEKCGRPDALANLGMLKEAQAFFDSPKWHSWMTSFTSDEMCGEQRAVTGHSRGGGVADLVAACAGFPMEVYTFGAPGVSKGGPLGDPKGGPFHGLRVVNLDYKETEFDLVPCIAHALSFWHPLSQVVRLQADRYPVFYDASRGYAEYPSRCFRTFAMVGTEIRKMVFGRNEEFGAKHSESHSMNRYIQIIEEKGKPARERINKEERANEKADKEKAAKVKAAKEEADRKEKTSKEALKKERETKDKQGKDRQAAEKATKEKHEKKQIEVEKAKAEEAAKTKKEEAAKAQAQAKVEKQLKATREEEAKSDAVDVVTANAEKAGKKAKEADKKTGEKETKLQVTSKQKEAKVSVATEAVSVPRQWKRMLKKQWMKQRRQRQLPPKK